MDDTSLFLPDLAWLKKRWSLPEPAEAIVTGFLQAELRGSTAHPLALAPGEELALGEAGVRVTPGADLPPTPKPLVAVHCDEQNAFLQSWLYYKAEHEIATRFHARAQLQAPIAFDPSQLGALWEKANDEQKQAVVTALARSLVLLTGGPGTGKTFTLALILTALSEAWIDGRPRVILAAPTGKAADQMKNSVLRTLQDLPPSYREEFKQAAEKSRTLHKLLEYNPGTGKCRYNAANPLACDLLIVDESSMCDVLLWQALLRAVPAKARLIIVGDPNQLQSVGPGDVLGELVRVARIQGSILQASWVHLKQNMRFKDHTAGIARLAKALEERSGEKTAEILLESRTSPIGLVWIEQDGDATLPFHRFPREVQAALTAVAAARTHEEALNCLGKICILTAFRKYSIGAEALNNAIEKHFAAEFLGENRHTQPIIINQNDPETGLKNGSIGVIVTDAQGQRKAWFASSEGQTIYRELPVGKLPEYSPAWVLTVHRSQGSEYDRVLVIVPKEESPMNNRELIYTAITRARSTVFILGTLEAVQKAAVTQSKRTTLTGLHLERIAASEGGRGSRRA